jgi:hypothetical protein
MAAARVNLSCSNVMRTPLLGTSGLGGLSAARDRTSLLPTPGTLPHITGDDRRKRVAYGVEMPSAPDGPVLGQTLAEWLAAREETRLHLATAAPPVEEEWVQRLADLLTTERSWQDQYTELVALGRTGGRFPPSQR